MKRLLAIVLLIPMFAACGADRDDLHTGKTVDATSEALVAVGLSHLTPEPTTILFYRRTDEIDDLGTKSPWTGGQLAFKGGLSLSLRVQKQTPELPSCRGPDVCHRVGAATMSWSPPAAETPGYLTVYLDKDGERRSAGLEGGGLGKDPLNRSMPIDVKDLAALVTDPAFALRTTQGAVDAGKDMPALAKKLTAERRAAWKARQAARPPSTTPRALAAQVADGLAEAVPNHPIVSGQESYFDEPGSEEPGWGIELTLRDGLRVHVSLIPGIGSAINGCQTGLECWTASGRRMVGQRGLAGVFRGNRESATSAHIWVEGPKVNPTSADYFLTLTGEESYPQTVVQTVAVMVDTLGFTTQDRWVDAGKKLDWFHD